MQRNVEAHAPRRPLPAALAPPSCKEPRLLLLRRRLSHQSIHAFSSSPDFIAGVSKYARGFLQLRILPSFVTVDELGEVDGQSRLHTFIEELLTEDAKATGNLGSKLCRVRLCLLEITSARNHPPAVPLSELTLAVLEGALIRPGCCRTRLHVKLEFDAKIVFFGNSAAKAPM